MQVITSTQGDNMMVFRAAALGGSGDSEFGSGPLAVAGEDISNIVLTTSKGGTAVGQVSFEGGRPPSLSSLRITSTAVDADGPSIGGMGSVKEDGTFELKGLSGTRVIRIGNAPPGWILKSVKLNGTDITDNGAEFKPGETTSGLDIELTQKSTTVTGSVSAPDGGVLNDYTIVIFSENPEHWRYPNTRWVIGSRPDQDGRVKVQNLPAGTYYAVAVDYLPTGEWGDPEVLDRLKVKGRRFSLAEGATENLDLKLTREY
jgi:hypothetical protein